MATKQKFERLLGRREIELPERIDLAFWRDQDGTTHGILQDYDGPIPPALRTLTSSWTRLRTPVRLLSWERSIPDAS